MSKVNSKIWFLLGIGLCSGFPLHALAAPFVFWPSTAEICGLFLAVHALLTIFFTNKKFRSQSSLMPAYFFLIYTILITTLSTLIFHYNYVYPLWAIFKLGEWFIICWVVIYNCGDQEISALAKGIIMGGLVNSIICIFQGSGLVSIQSMLAIYRNNHSAGPWGAMDLRPDHLGAIGVYSYSRICTGFLLVLTAVAILATDWARLRKNILVILCIIAIIFTGSRMAMLCLAIFLARFSGFNVKTFVVSFLFMLIITSGVLSGGFENLETQPIVGRFLGAGNEDVSIGISEREERQQIIFELSPMQLMVGVGLGNLGSATKMGDLGFKLYRAHGAAFTYLAEIGVFGFILLIIFMKMVYGRRRRRITNALVLAMLITIVFDDLYIPSAQASFLPVISAIIFRYCEMNPEAKPQFLKMAAS